MLVLGVVIGASLAMASPSRPAAVLSVGSPLTVADQAAVSPRAAKPHACAESIEALAHRDHDLTQAIAGVLAKCKENPQAPALVNALLHRPGNAESGGADPSGTDPGAGGGGSGGTASAGSGGTGGTGGSGSTSSGGSGGGSGSGSTGGGGSGSTTGGGGSGSGSTGGGGSGSTTGGGKDNNGKAKGQYDGKGNNG
jgi:hypothetical protein